MKVPKKAIEAAWGAGRIILAVTDKHGGSQALRSNPFAWMPILEAAFLHLPLRTRAEERLIKAALEWLVANDWEGTGVANAAEAVRRERERRVKP